MANRSQSYPNRSQSHPQPKRRLINLRDVAAELDVSFRTVDRLIRAGSLPFVRLPGGLRRVAREDLDRLIEDWKAESR